jgi:hypothetical protein
LVARVNGVDVPFSARGIAEVTTSGGQFNLNGEITIFAAPDTLKQRIDTIAKALLPYRIPTESCAVNLLRLSDIDITVQDFSAKIAATATLSIACSIINQERDVPIKIVLAPVLKDKQTLGWQVLRDPDIQLPLAWWIALEFIGTDPPKVFKASLGKFLDAHAAIKLPSLDRVSAAFKGANVDGGSKGKANGNADPATEISLRIKGDVHASGATVTKLLAPLVKVPEIEVSFVLP